MFGMFGVLPLARLGIVCFVVGLGVKPLLSMLPRLRGFACGAVVLGFFAVGFGVPPKDRRCIGLGVALGFTDGENRGSLGALGMAFGHKVNADLIVGTSQIGHIFFLAGKAL